MHPTDYAAPSISPKIGATSNFIPGDAALVYAVGIAVLRASIPTTTGALTGLLPSGVAGVWIGLCALTSVLYVLLLRSKAASQDSNDNHVVVSAWVIIAVLISFFVYAVGLDNVWTGVQPLWAALAMVGVLPILYNLNQFVAILFPGQEL
jgi:hypothetical protein